MNWLQMEQWSPYAVGIGIGMLSWVSFLLSDQGLACSTAFARSAGMIELIFRGKRVQDKPYYRKFAPEIDWGWMLVLGVLIGAFASAQLSGTFRLQWGPRTVGSHLRIIRSCEEPSGLGWRRSYWDSARAGPEDAPAAMDQRNTPVGPQQLDRGRLLLCRRYIDGETDLHSDRSLRRKHVREIAQNKEGTALARAPHGNRLRIPSAEGRGHAIRCHHGPVAADRFTVVKIMLTAMATGMVGIYAMRSLGLARLNPKPGGVGSSVVGGLIFGVGFATLDTVRERLRAPSATVTWTRWLAERWEF